MQRVLLIIVAVFLLLEFYIYQAVKNFGNHPLFRWGYWIITLDVYGLIFYEIYHFSRGNRNGKQLSLLMGLITVFVFPKLLVVIFLLIDDITMFFGWIFNFISSKESHYPGRRNFLTALGLFAGGALSALFLDGIVFGKYRHSVRRVKIKLTGLPQSFKGYKVLQISDVHSGTFQHPEKLQHAIDLINEQNADLVLFTGDMVNNYSFEFEPFVKLFSTIKAKDGKYSVLGNHDYGSYGNWTTEEEHALNLPKLIELQRQAGFKMLRNQHAAIEKNGEKLYILGVENWGEKPFPQYGDLDKASAGVPPEAAKILMSHDPTHFDQVVKFHRSNVQLTLSGHTHGMQFGIDLKNVKWSPVQYRYKKWADLYESNGKYLYVNRGFGVLAFPGRVGIKPEITVFELI